VAERTPHTHISLTPVYLCCTCGSIDFAQAIEILIESSYELVLRWHRFAPEEKNKENGNDTDCLRDSGDKFADVGCFGHVASRTDCTAHWLDFH